MQRYKIRTLGKKYGLDQDELYSYDPNTRAVSYGGRLLTIADDEVDGVSYKNSEQDFLDDVRDWHKSGGDELVAVRDYVATSGSRNGYQAPKVDFEAGEGRVLIGGSTLKPSFISEDGRAYAPKSQIDAILDKAVPQTPVYEDRYADRIDNAESRLAKKTFSYDPEDDPAYHALRTQYRREGDRALADTTGQLAALTGGRISSAAAAAGAQARMQYAEKLGDRIPELAADAYARYRDEVERDERALDRLYDESDAAYKRYTDRVAQHNAEAEAANASAAYREGQPARDAEHQLTLRNLSTKTAEEYQSRALIRGYYTPEEAAYLGVPEDASPWSGELARAAAMSEQEFADYLKRSELDKATEKELIDYREASAKREAQYKSTLTASRAASSSSTGNDSHLKLTKNEARQRLTKVMAGNAASGMPYLYAIKNAIEKNHPMLVELGLSYGLDIGEVQMFLNETYETVHQQILYHEKDDSNAWMFYGKTLWGR